jgi:hypothetical protein
LGLAALADFKDVVCVPAAAAAVASQRVHEDGTELSSFCFDADSFNFVATEVSSKLCLQVKAHVATRDMCMGGFRGRTNLPLRALASLLPLSRQNALRQPLQYSLLRIVPKVLLSREFVNIRS